MTAPVSGDPTPARRIVICQYDAEPHPINDECVNVIDVETTEAASRD